MTADVPPELIERVRREARRQRRLTAAERRRIALAGIVDTGSLSDEDVKVLYDEYVAARESGRR